MKVLIICGETNRTLCYMNAFSELKNIELEVVLYGYTNKKLDPIEINEKTINYLNQQNVQFPKKSFDSFLDLINENNWPITILEHKDINSDEIMNCIEKSDAELVIFSGYGGQILRNPGFFNHNWKVLHMHPGDIPSERGSTTLYYSILNNNKLTVSSFYMTETIDEGEIVLKTHYSIPNEMVEIDIWVDPLLRADCLKKSLIQLTDGGDVIKKDSNSQPENNEEYYVIHPVLKHISLLSINK